MSCFDVILAAFYHLKCRTSLSFLNTGHDAIVMEAEMA